MEPLNETKYRTKFVINLALGIVLFFFIRCSSSITKEENERESTARSELIVSDPIYDFKHIKLNDSVSHVFKITNISKRPIKILAVNSSCGCTVPSLKDDVVEPDETNEIKVLFKPQAIGQIDQEIVLRTDGKTSFYVLGLIGKVVDN